MRSRHPAWCATGHRCGLGEHRSHPHPVDADRMVLTRVRDSRGQQWAEVRIRLPLAGDDRAAAGQLVRLVQLLRGLGAVLRAPTRRPLARGRAGATTR